MAYILSSQDVRITQQPASIAARLMALLVDGGIVLFVYFMYFELNVYVLFESESTVLIAILLFFLPLMYPLIAEVSTGGQTVGKQLVNTRVVTLEGGGPKLSSFILRWMLLPFDLFMAMGLGELCVFFTKRQQRLGDLAAGTWVVRTNTHTSEHPDLSVYTIKEGQPDSIPYPLARNISPRQASLIAEVLEAYNCNEVYFAAYKLKNEVEKIVGEAVEEDSFVFLSNVLQSYRQEASANKK